LSVNEHVRLRLESRSEHMGVLFVRQIAADRQEVLDYRVFKRLFMELRARPATRAWALLFSNLANLLRFRAFPGGGVGGNYTASLSNTALHRSWMLAERAFGQLASVCSRSVSLASPCRPIRCATL
jgi:hypothetical protein